ncbi:hypothetical protein CC85DRAFT_129668 [Cutaneotrichosporon oleaginosum]|uniref:Uncharacterized protein n=1 Tax=Cutaneotrichosporon oleaginosum TaxID=879819 RepID=A0A0J0XIX8_9TREE|nr:uncharacterized protein CC85DRAFT_129668 [Cutaneotrichosporon oleaginosum]KLT41031.1 hypothetical protein CC85DRAFT_129668 [Cutaneotrichosporon oleaginosum]TXT12123.1 hypothetical protein COLE_02533 [Cutaneotrichosporon oleaginosum]
MVEDLLLSAREREIIGITLHALNGERGLRRAIAVKARLHKEHRHATRGSVWEKAVELKEGEQHGLLLRYRHVDIIPDVPGADKRHETFNFVRISAILEVCAETDAGDGAVREVFEWHASDHTYVTEGKGDVNGLKFSISSPVDLRQRLKSVILTRLKVTSSRWRESWELLRLTPAGSLSEGLAAFRTSRRLMIALNTVRTLTGSMSVSIKGGQGYE